MCVIPGAWSFNFLLLLVHSECLLFGSWSTSWATFSFSICWWWVNWSYSILYPLLETYLSVSRIYLQYNFLLLQPLVLFLTYYEVGLSFMVDRRGWQTTSLCVFHLNSTMVTVLTGRWKNCQCLQKPRELSNTSWWICIWSWFLLSDKDGVDYL